MIFPVGVSFPMENALEVMDNAGGETTYSLLTRTGEFIAVLCKNTVLSSDEITKNRSIPMQKELRILFDSKKGTLLRGLPFLLRRCLGEETVEGRQCRQLVFFGNVFSPSRALKNRRERG